MGLFNNNNNPPAFYYVYGNKSYEEEIYNYLVDHFQNVIKLNLSSVTGCGFKFVSYDIGELRTLDVILENYEGWLQTGRRTDFNDLNSDFLDLDNFTVGCNHRLTPSSVITWDMQKIAWYVNAHKKTVAIRNLNYANTSGANGDITMMFGSDKIVNAIVNNIAIDSNKIIRKNLNGEVFSITGTNITFNGYVVEYKGDEYRNFKVESTSCTVKESAPFTYISDGEINSRYPLSLNGGYGGGGIDSFVLSTNEGEYQDELLISGSYLNILFCPLSYIGDATQKMRLIIYLQTRHGSSFSPQTEIHDVTYPAVIPIDFNVGHCEWLTVPIPAGLTFNRISFSFWGLQADGVTTTNPDDMWATIYEMFVSA